MLIGKRIARTLLCGLALLAAGCSSGGGSGGSASISTAVQNLTLDPTGHTTVLTLSKGFAGLGPVHLRASDGQAAQTVTTNGSAVTVTWDVRVTPSHQVRVQGVAGFSDAWRPVSTSDSSALGFTIDSATQTPGLGWDEIELSFSGPNAVASTVEDPASWELTVGGNVLDLAGSVFAFDAGAQTLSIILGPLANLHASFSLRATGVLSVADVPASATAVVGNAGGDVTPPSLLTAIQVLGEDEYGRVIDFTFDKSMDPVTSLGLSRFSAPSPNAATEVEQPFEDVLRVTFATPVIPGVHQVTLNGLTDNHGNALPDGATAISQPAPVANDYDGAPEAITVANAGGDYVTLTTDQAFDSESAVDPANWYLEVDSIPVVLADQTLTYDFLSKTLLIELDFDMRTGAPFEIGGLAVLEIDGQTFSGVHAGNVTGDVAAPTVSGMVQNRNVDPSGLTLQVTFSEDVDEASAEIAGNYVPSDDGISVLSATLLPSGSVVRLVLDTVAVPGVVTFTVDGVEDLAGNLMPAPQVGIVLTSTDLSAPQLTHAAATALEGANDDTIVVTFSDDMFAADVENAGNWSFESPIGSAFDLTGCSIDYNASTRQATLTLDTGGLDLKRDSDFQVELTGVRDIGGNTIAAGEFSGDVEFENVRPTIVSVWRDSFDTNQIVLRFSEPCADLDDLYDPLTNLGGARYTLWDGVVERGRPSSATVLEDGLGVRLVFGFLVSLDDTLDVFGIADRAGNYMFPQTLLPLEVEDGSIPSFDFGFSSLTALSGEANDVVTFVFDVPMNPWRLLEPENFRIATGGNPLDLEGAELSFDGQRTVEIRFGRSSDVDLQKSSLHDIRIQNVQSAQGVTRVLAADETDLPVDGDGVAPQIGLTDVRIDPLNANSVLIVTDEALSELGAADPFNYNYFGFFATGAVQVSPRVVRATFPVTVFAGDPVDSFLVDRAGNNSGNISRIIQAADGQVPLLSGVAGFSVPGFGGDTLRISFNEPVDPGSALDSANYTVTNGGNPVSLVGATSYWESATLTVVFELASSVALDPSQPLSFTVRNVADWSGNAISAGGVTLGGAVSGDTLAPGVSSAFVNWRESEPGQAVDVLFSEEVQPSFSGDATNWTSSGAQSVLSVQVLANDAVRVHLSAPLGVGDDLQLAGGLSDPAGNTAGAIAFTPDH